MRVKRTERGWAGHFICADNCMFRRNTLLECGEIKIVVSTVGNMKASLKGQKSPVEIGMDRLYETMAFHSMRDDTIYHDSDVNREIYFDSKWAISAMHESVDNEANEMHEAVVKELSRKLRSGKITNEPVEDLG